MLPGQVEQSGIAGSECASTQLPGSASRRTCSVDMASYVFLSNSVNLTANFTLTWGVAAW